MYEIITDGACRGNPGPGGWAALIMGDGTITEIGGAEAQTTNNRMELRAAIEALRQVPPDAPVRLITDSTYLLKGATRWIKLWKKRDWLTINETPVENRDLWEELDALAGQRVRWELVRGHSGDPHNERANAIAQAYAAGRAPELRSESCTECAGAITRAASHAPGPHGDPARRGVRYLSLVQGVLERHMTWDACRARVHGVSGARWKKCVSDEEERATVTSWGLPVTALAALDTA
ncbi:MAG: ribonuclease HI [Chloroflexi bacterium]|nr:ribonuclease HI [Chloroflexota bacterium]